MCCKTISNALMPDASIGHERPSSAGCNLEALRHGELEWGKVSSLWLQADWTEYYGISQGPSVQVEVFRRDMHIV